MDLDGALRAIVALVKKGKSAAADAALADLMEMAEDFDTSASEIAERYQTLLHGPIDQDEIDAQVLPAAQAAAAGDAIGAAKLLKEAKNALKKQGVPAKLLDEAFAKLRKGMKAEAKLLKAKAHAQAQSAADPSDTRAEFLASEHDRSRVVDEIKALLKPEHMLFNYGGVMREVVIMPQPFGPPQPVLREVPTPQAGRFIERVAKFYREDPVTGLRFRTHVPAWAEQKLAASAAEGLPVLAGIIRHPVLTPCGDLRCGRLGYDETTQFLTWCEPVDGIDPNVWESPQAAFDWLVDEWLGQVSFASRADAARALMIPLTLLKARTCLAHRGKYAGFMVTAPSAQSGKTILAEALIAAVTGIRPLARTYAEGNEEEMVKFLNSISLEDPSVLFLDNARNGSSIRSPSLDAFITNSVFSARVLGTNTISTGSALPMVVLTGNNIEVAEDTKTRILEIRIIPDGRKIKYNVNFIEDTLSQRNLILSALWAILDMDIPEGAEVPASRFPAWSREIAAPVALASGEADLLEAFRDAKEEGASTKNVVALAEFLEALAKKQVEGRPDGLLTREIVDELLDEIHELCRLPQADYDTATALLDPDASEMQQGKVWKDRQAARKRISSGLDKRLRRWRDQAGGEFRLTMIKSKGADRHPALRFKAEPLAHHHQ